MRFPMLELKPSMGKANDSALTVPEKSGSREQSQRRMMLVALVLLFVALIVVIYRDRDFWFPDTEDADDLDPVPATVTIETQPVPATAKALIPEKAATSASRKHHSTAVAADPAPSATTTTPAMLSNTRTVLPPLEVEVVAGDYHSRVRPSANSLRVDLRPDSPSQRIADGVDQASASNMTTNAAEHLRISAEAADVVSQPVRPGYPVLARQMKVQGSVILQALIGRDGLIQDLHVMTGPPILAEAAQEAVRQWRFKPHYMNNEPVETQTSITVNFTISTN